MKTPWYIYAPNGTGSIGYRPIHVHDADKNQLFYVGDNSKTNAFDIASKVVASVNTLAHNAGEKS